VAFLTAGIVDPTIGSALVALGYDRDFDDLDTEGTGPPGRPEPAPGWWTIHLDPERRTAAIPPGVHVDLGSTAKAFAADRTAGRIADALGCGVLVNLGGDVAVSGPPPRGGWAVGIAAKCTTPVDAVDQVVAISGGGLASSGTTARSWVRNGRRVHHIVDPWTGEAAAAVWSLVSATAQTCVEANAWSTASVVWGEDAIGNLAAGRVCARLVRSDGEVVRVGGWPDDAVTSVTSDTGDRGECVR
jgi:thiamine biosynthesis lipoprotein